jgi:hypothetical protein
MANSVFWRHSAALSELRLPFINRAQRSVNRKVQGSNPWSGAKPELENRVLILAASTRTAVAFSNRGVIQDLVNSNGSSGTIGLLSG